MVTLTVIILMASLMLTMLIVMTIPHMEFRTIRLRIIYGSPQ